MSVRRYADPIGARRAVVLTIGNFDGLHTGHRQVLAATREAAAKYGVMPVAVTFAVTPYRFFQPQHFAGELIVVNEKIQRLEMAGMAEVLLLTPTPELMNKSPEEFLDDLWRRYEIKAVAVGENFRFGAKAAGDVSFLAEYGKKHGFETISIPLKQSVTGEETVSSTAIRRGVLNGDMQKVARYLGRYWSISGIVKHGEARGKRLGFPTANLTLEPGRVAPKNGVYATVVRWRGNILPAVTNVGTKPTFGLHEKSIETHLLDFSQEIYGEPIRVYFVDYLREEKKFNSVEALQKQIQTDTEEARRCIENNLEIDKCD